MRLIIRGKRGLTGVSGCDCALDDDGREAIEAGQGIDDLLESGELGNHVEE